MIARVRRLLRERREQGVDLRHGGRFRVDVRVPSTDWYRCGLSLCNDELFVMVDVEPPAAGPEVQVTMLINAARADAAERAAHRRLARYGFGTVLASRASRAR